MVNRNNFAERFLFSTIPKRWLCNVGQNLRVGSDAMTMTMSMKTETGGTQLPKKDHGLNISEKPKRVNRR